MKIIDQVSELKKWRQTLFDKKIGFVPTMGALHEGHLSLVKKARSECDLVVVSIFVNPTQFNNPNDLDTYPNQLDNDFKLLSQASTDVVFTPSKADMYPEGYRFQLQESEVSGLLCGKHRPGHFNGVLTVVMKLFQIVQPTFAYFGEKDFQQLQLIKDLAKDFFMDVEVKSGPTVRETDGLAMSSRNLNLSPEQRSQAPTLNQIIKNSTTCEEAIQKLQEQGFQVDYVEEWRGRRLAAARLGSVRLIDNVEL